MAKTTGRKPSADRKDRGITVWVSREQGELIDRAAAGADIPTAVWARSVLLKAAREVTASK